MTIAKSTKSPTPPPPSPRRLWCSSSVTMREIEKFWRKKRLVEEDHFLAAIKAAARLRASRLSVIFLLFVYLIPSNLSSEIRFDTFIDLISKKVQGEDYLLFLDDIEEDSDSVETENRASSEISHQEIRVGIMDWWTKSKYAYLNQPAVGSSGRRSRRSNYTPNKFYYCNYKYSPAAAPPATTVSVSAQAQAPALPPYLGVF